MFPTTHAFLREPKGVFSLNFGVSTKFTRFSGSFECFWATWSVLTNQIRVDFLENMSVLTNQIRAKTWQYGAELSLNIGVNRSPNPRVFRTTFRGFSAAQCALTAAKQVQQLTTSEHFTKTACSRQTQSVVFAERWYSSLIKSASFSDKLARNFAKR